MHATTVRPSLAGWAARAGGDVVAGAVASLAPLTNAFTYAALIFSGPWAPLLSQGIATLLVSSAAIAIVVGLTSGFRVAVAGPNSLTSALLAAILLHLAPEFAGQPPGVAAASAFAVMGIATLLTGLALLGLRALRLGDVVRLTPAPVIVGVLGASGWVMMEGTTRMVTGLPLSLWSLSGFAGSQAGLRFAGLLAFAGVLSLTTRWVRHPLTVPLTLIGAVAATDAALHLSGVPFAAARAADILFDVMELATPSIPILSGALAQADWPVILWAAPCFAPVVIIGVVQSLATATSVELLLDVEVDLNKELQSQGLANLVSAAAGGIMGFTAASYTSANVAAHGRGRLSVVVVGLVMLAVLAGGTGVITFVPRAVLGGLLFWLGAGLFWTAGVGSLRTLPRGEWLLTITMIVVTAVIGFLPALVTGLIGSCVLLALSLSRVGIVQRSYGLDEAGSTVQRSEAEMQLLAVRGGEARVIELAGFLFFGSVNQLHAEIKALLGRRRVRTLILDFARVSGADSSVRAVLGRIRSLAARSGVQLVVSGMPPRLAPMLQSIGPCPAQLRRTLDEAIEGAEDALLAAEGAHAGSSAGAMEEWLAEALGDAAGARLLSALLDTAQYQAGDVLCRQGEVADTLFFVSSGRINVMVTTPGQPDTRLRTFAPRTIAGELGFLLGARRSATLQVERTAIVGQLHRDAFQRLRATNPDLALTLLDHLARVQAERLALATGQIMALRR